MEKNTNEEPISALSLAKALSSPPRLTYERLAAHDSLKELPSPTQLPCEVFAVSVLIKDILFEIAPIPHNMSKFSIKNRPKEDFYFLNAKDFIIIEDKPILDSVAEALARKVNKAFNFKEITIDINPSNSDYSYLDIFIYAYCRIVKKISHPIIKARLEIAGENDDRKFLIRLGKELAKSKSKYELKTIEGIMILGWPMSMHKSIPPLCLFTDEALTYFFSAVMGKSYSLDKIRKDRQRLGLIQSENKRVTVIAGKPIYS